MNNHIATDILRTEIASRLHTLTPSRPIVMAWANVTITYDDYMKASDGQALGQVLGDPSKLDCVLDELDAVANSRWICN